VPLCFVFKKQSHFLTDVLVLLLVLSPLKCSASPVCRWLALMLVCYSIVVTHRQRLQQCNVLQTRPGPRLQPHWSIPVSASSLTALAVQNWSSISFCIDSQQVARNTSLWNGLHWARLWASRRCYPICWSASAQLLFTACTHNLGWNQTQHCQIYTPSYCHTGCRTCVDQLAGIVPSNLLSFDWIQQAVPSDLA